MDTLPVVEWLTLNATYTLTTPITVCEISQDERDSDRFGPICEVLEGTELNVCGAGFNKRTVMVRHGGCYYYVFWRDLASAAIGDRSATLDEDEHVGLLVRFL